MIENNQCMTKLQHYFDFNEELNHIFLVIKGNNDDDHRKVTKDIWKGILQYPLWGKLM